MCWAQKQLPLSGCGSLQKQSNTLNNSPGEIAVSPTVDTAVFAAVSNHTAIAGVMKVQKKFIIEKYQCNSNWREIDETPTRKKKIHSAFLKLMWRLVVVHLYFMLQSSNQTKHPNQIKMCDS